MELCGLRVGAGTEELDISSLHVLPNGRLASCTVCTKHIQFISHDTQQSKNKNIHTYSNTISRQN